VLYETAWVDDAGTANFREDIYGRDKRLAETLRRRTRAATVGVLNARAGASQGS
jgi:murein L,D-transpeptidase YcbB/YkuD